MKISTYRIASIKGLVHDLSELESLIQLHLQHSSSDDIMVSQYEAKKYERFQQLIRHLLHPSLNRDGFSTFPLIQKLTERFYPSAKAGLLKNGELKELEDAMA